MGSAHLGRALENLCLKAEGCKKEDEGKRQQERDKTRWETHGASEIKGPVKTYQGWVVKGTFSNRIVQGSFEVV